MPSLPKYSKTDALGNRGVRVVEEVVEDELGWAFRPKRKVDLGVDGEIEILNKDRESSGRLLGVQIKCGARYLKEKTKTGYVYRGQQKHLKYWLSHSLPILVVLCDPNKRTCYWAEVTAGAVRGGLENLDSRLSGVSA